MMSDATAKAGEEKRYAPRKAKLYDSEKLYQYKVPDFSMQDLLSAIPAHCFHRSTLFSSMYMLVDFLQAALLFYCASWIDPLTENCSGPYYLFLQQRPVLSSALAYGVCMVSCRVWFLLVSGSLRTNVVTRHLVLARM